MTLTELLTVVAVIAILVSMMSPILMRAAKEATRRKCMGNMSQISVGLNLIANDNFGKLPKCYDLQKHKKTWKPKEATWWYRKVARVMYPVGKFKKNTYDHLTVPRRRNKNWWRKAAKEGSALQKWHPDHTIFRCPASTDMYDEKWQPQQKPRASGVDKDRVFDDNYGYNNYGFKYRGKGYGGQCTIYYKHGGRFFQFSRLYHKRCNRGKGGYKNPHAIHGRYITPGHKEYDPDFAYIGALADYPDPAGTILLMDYVKADIAPSYDSRGDVKVGGQTYHYPDGGRFRHGERANVLFVDGHVEGFRDRIFRQAVAEGSRIHWHVKRRP
jgi:prepilin-type processing-associated H-X9-DG protein